MIHGAFPYLEQGQLDWLAGCPGFATVLPGLFVGDFGHGGGDIGQVLCTGAVDFLTGLVGRR
jgi:hypothetical protein